MHPMPESWFDNPDVHMAPVLAAYVLGLLVLLLSYMQA